MHGKSSDSSNHGYQRPQLPPLNGTGYSLSHLSLYILPQDPCIFGGWLLCVHNGLFGTAIGLILIQYTLALKLFFFVVQRSGTPLSLSCNLNEALYKSS